MHAVDGVSFDVARGEVAGARRRVGLRQVVTAMALLRLLPPRAQRRGLDRASTAARAASARREARAARIRGRRDLVVFQEPMTSLNPVFTVGRQIGEVLRRHLGIPAQARERAVELLDLVGIPAPERRVDEYPHQLSGGMRQRVMIAMAIACEPSADRRRADDRARRDDPGRRARRAPRAARPARHGDRPDHPRSRRRRRHRRPRRRHVRRARSRRRRSHELFAHPQHPYTIGAARRGAAGAGGDRTAAAAPARARSRAACPRCTGRPSTAPFADRCPRADDAARSEVPPLEEVGPGTSSRASTPAEGDRPT